MLHYILEKKNDTVKCAITFSRRSVLISISAKRSSAGVTQVITASTIQIFQFHSRLFVILFRPFKRLVLAAGESITCNCMTKTSGDAWQYLTQHWCKAVSFRYVEPESQRLKKVISLPIKMVITCFQPYKKYSSECGTVDFINKVDTTLLQR